jgi:uncharacterized damage-inducible protein DinB
MATNTTIEVWQRGPVDGIAPVLQPVAHALIQVQEDVATLAPGVPIEVLWARRNAATAGFHLLHLAASLDRLFTYARGETLTDEQKAAARAEATPRPDLDGPALSDIVTTAVDMALAQLRATDPGTAFDFRGVGRAQLPSTVIGLLFHAAEHSTRHAGQFVTTVKILTA